MDLSKKEYDAKEIREYVLPMSYEKRRKLLMSLIADSHKSLVDKNLCRRNIVT